jgi:excisionase family DNA binding protein
MPSTPSNTLATDDLLRVSEVAKRLDIHVSSVYRLVDSGRLAAHVLGNGKIRRRGIRVLSSSVDQLLKDSVVTAVAA